MPLKNEIDKLKKNIQDSQKLIKDNSVEFWTVFQKFKSLLAQCSTRDGVSIDEVVEQIGILAYEGSEDTIYHKNPEKIVCIATAVLGLNTFIQDQVTNIHKQLGTYKKGFLPYLENIWKDIYVELNPGKIGDAFKTQLNNTYNNILDVGIGLMSEYVNEKTTVAEDWVENAIKKDMAKIGKYFSFLMISSNEFKWATYLIFLENLKRETENRINNLIALKQAIRDLIFDINLANSEGTSISIISLESYIAALTLLEDTLYFTKGFNKKLAIKNEFDAVFNNAIINNLDEVKKLLLLQKNEFLSKYLKDETILTEDPNLVYNFYLPNNITTRGDLLLLTSTGEDNSESFLKDLSKIETLYIQRNTKNIAYNDVCPIIKELDIDNSFWIETILPVDETTEFIKLGKNIFKIKTKFSIDTNELEQESIKTSIPTGSRPTQEDILNFSGFIDKDPEDKFIYALELENLHPSYYVNNVNLNDYGNIQEYFNLQLDIDYSFSNSPVEIKMDDNSYEITEVDKQVVNTITMIQTGLKKINSEWNKSINWKAIAFIKYEFERRFKKDPVFVTLQFTGELPSFPEKIISTEQTIVSDLPEPLASALKNIDLKKLSDFNNLSSDMSNFLYGKDILDGTTNKIGEQIGAYNKFIKSGTSVLEKICPIKNSIYTYYSLLEQSFNINNSHENVANKITKDWMLKINAVIESTINSMTFKNFDTGEFNSINEIKQSKLYYKLIPSLLLDFDNAYNIDKLANFNKYLGDLFIKNSLLDSKFLQYDAFIKWMGDTDKLNSLKNNEQELWNMLGTSFLSSLKLMLKAERIDSLKPVFDSLELKLDNLIIDLSEISERINELNSESFQSHNSLIKLLDDIGLEHFSEYLKNGKVDIFINDNVDFWMGKYGPAVNCLNNIANNYVKGEERNYLLSVANYMKYLDVNYLLTLAETSGINIDFSINLNFLNKISNETIADLKSTIKKTNVAVNASKIVKKIKK